MKIYDGSVVIWYGKGRQSEGRVFNEISKADKFFQQCVKKELNPQWDRLFPRYIEFTEFKRKGKR